MIFNYESLQAFLADELQRRVKTNARYSLRSFARTLRLSPGALSEILRGRRDVSLKAIPYIAQSIGLNAAEAKHLLYLAQKAKAEKEGVGKINQTPPSTQKFLSEDLFNLIAEWHHFAILNLLDCDEFEWRASWFAQRLGLTKLQAQIAMDLLLRMGLVVKERGKYRGAMERLHSSSEIPSQAIRSYHRQILEKALAALETQGLNERDFSGCGFAIDPTHLSALKKDISEFQDRLVAKYSRGCKSEVYFLEMALFRLTMGRFK